MKSFKKIAVLLCIVLLVSTCVVGCGSKKNNITQDDGQKNNAGSKVEEEEVVLSVWSYPMGKGVFEYDPEGSDEDFMNYASEEFKKICPNVTIKYEVLPYNGGPEKINVSLTGGNPPDILIDGDVRQLSYANRGVLVPLNDILEGEDDINQAVIDKLTVGGKKYLYPLHTIPMGLAVNLDLFRKADALDLLPQNEDGTWTYDEFKEALRAVCKLDGVYGYGLFSGNEQGDATTFSLIWGAGATTLDKGRTKCLLNSPEGVEGLEFLVSLIDEGLVPPGAGSFKGSDIIEMFVQQQIAICFASPGTFTSFQKSFDEGLEEFEMDFVMHPNKEGASPKTVTYENAICAFDTKDENRIKWSKELIKFLGNSENSKRSKVSRGIPVRKSLENMYQGEDPILNKATKFVKYSGDYGMDMKGIDELRSVFYPEMQAAFTKKKTPKQALDDFAAKVDEIIKKYYD
jgi:multiple sugar transport system substrate-binding protein